MRTMMKKVVSRTLLVLNWVLIGLLLLLSVGLLLLSHTPKGGIAGYTPMLVASAAEGSSSANLLLLRSLEEPQTGRQILLMESGTPEVVTVTRIEDGFIYYDTPEGENATELSEQNCRGEVVWESAILGTFLQAVSGPEHLFLSLVCIGGGFLLCAGVLFLLYFLSARAGAPRLESEEDWELLCSLVNEPEEDGAESDYEIAEEDEISVEERNANDEPNGETVGEILFTGQMDRWSWEKSDDAESTEEVVELIYSAPAHVKLDRTELDEVKVYEPHSASAKADHNFFTDDEAASTGSSSIEDLLRDIEKQFEEGLTGK